MQQPIYFNRDVALNCPIGEYADHKGEPIRMCGKPLDEPCPCEDKEGV